MCENTNNLVRRYGTGLVVSVVALGLDWALGPMSRVGTVSLVTFSVSVGAILIALIGAGAGPGGLATLIVSVVAALGHNLGLAVALLLLGGLMSVACFLLKTPAPAGNEADSLVFFDQNPGAMWVVDARSGAFLAVNRVAERLVGYRAEELSRLTSHALKVGDEEESSARRVWGLRRNDGTVLDVEISSRPILFAGREARLELLVDRTERERVEAALRLGQKESEDAYQALEQFVAVVGHELRTPLSPVLPAVSMLLDNDPPGPLRSMLEMIQRNVELQGRLIDDLLDVVRADRGKLRLAVEPVDIRALVDRVLEICRNDLDAGGVHLEVCLEIPEPAPMVRADPTRLLQVLWNLLRNANKFTPKGGRVRLHVGFERAEVSEPGQGGWLVVEVSDTGPGLAAEDLDRIFKPFEQVGPNAAGKTSIGLGLGLAISQSIAESHGGRLTASSPGPGQGSRFILRLPAEFRARSEVVAPRPHVPPRRSLKILLVDDNSDLRGFLTMALERMGARVHACENVTQALEALETERFDLLISDLELPDGNGRELMQALHAQGGLPAIALSGHGSVEDVDLSLAAGFTTHLTKPITFPQLEAAIGQVFSAAAPVG